MLPDESLVRASAETIVKNEYRPYSPLRTIYPQAMPLHDVHTTYGGGFLGRAKTLNRRNVLQGYALNASSINIGGPMWNVERKTGQEGEVIYLTREGEKDIVLSNLDELYIQNDGLRHDLLYLPRGESFNFPALSEAQYAWAAPMGGWRDEGVPSIDYQLTDMRKKRPLLALNDLTANYGEATARSILWQTYRGVQWFKDRFGLVFLGGGETGGSLGTVKEDERGLVLEEPMTGQSLMRGHYHFFWNSVLADLGITTILNERDKQPWDRRISWRLGANVAYVLNQIFNESAMREKWKGAKADTSALGPWFKLPGFQPAHIRDKEFARVLEVLALNMHRQWIEFWQRYNVDFQRLVDFVQEAYVDEGEPQLDLSGYRRLQAVQLPSVYQDPEVEYIADAIKRGKLLIPGGWGFLGWLDDEALYILTAFILEKSYYNADVGGDLGFLGLECGMVQTKRQKNCLPPAQRQIKENLYRELNDYMMARPPF